MTPAVTDPGTTDTDSGASATASARPRRRRRLRWAALATAGLLLTVAATGWSLYTKLDANIRTDSDTAQALAPYELERPAPVEGTGEARNILLLGSDNRGDGNGAWGRDEGSERSDTTILLHIAADRDSATAMSIPRDLMVDIPDCRRRDGTPTRAQFAQFNWAFQNGGAACAIRTVEKMTDIRIDHHLVADFQGFTELVDAVGGVEVCLARPVHDREAKLDLPAGRQTLGGQDALGYVRARHGLGNGSDTQRIERQQRFLGSLVKKVRSNGVLLNPAKAYPVLDAATSSLTADSGLDSLSELYELTRSVRDIPQDHIRFLTVPRQPYEPDINRDALVRPAADELFAKLREDRPIRVESKDADKGEAKKDKNDVAEDGRDKAGQPYRGTTAARDICTNE
ncbi:LCP family protein [Streptomyces tubbatahanensis]|uniref:LCP family protein n=1 Tax=Streptomyces tubbatahanensis TaxID=2923272 RepID=A0ABY3XSQ1_9ACTN|nr:LCP family protein [Streptomyces tubbatahanensis]UNS97371.1 LCP family protein [Streptomyces tubbatahanensis]